MSTDKEIPFHAPTNLFAAEDAKRAELEKSPEVIDQLTAVLMTPHVGEQFTDHNDAFGLWYSFARPKAVVIMERFNVTAIQKLSDQSN